MRSIKSFFGEAGTDIFDVMPHQGWVQQAPLIDDRLAFNQQKISRLDKINGAMVLTPSVDIEGLEISYAPFRLMKGFFVGKKRIDTESYNRLTIQDYSDHVNLVISNEDIAFPHGLTKQEQAAVISLFATAALDKYCRIRAGIDVELDNMANPNN